MSAKKTLILISILCTSFTSQLFAQVKFDGRSMVIDGLLLLQDSKDTNGYYYLPKFPTLATNKDSLAEFLFIKYQGEDESSSGGLFHALIEFTASDNLVMSAQKKLQKKFPKSRIIGRVPILPSSSLSGEDNTPSFEVISSVLKNGGEDGMTRTLITSGAAPLTPGSKAAVAALLDKRGATLLWSSLSSGPTSDVSVGIRGYYEAVIPAFNATITVNMKDVFKSFNENNLKKTFKTTNDISSAIDSSIKSGAIKVNVEDRSGAFDIDNEKMNALVDLITTKITDMMFVPAQGEIPPTPAEPAMGSAEAPGAMGMDPMMMMMMMGGMGGGGAAAAAAAAPTPTPDMTPASAAATPASASSKPSSQTKAPSTPVTAPAAAPAAASSTSASTAPKTGTKGSAAPTTRPRSTGGTPPPPSPSVAKAPVAKAPVAKAPVASPIAKAPMATPVTARPAMGAPGLPKPGGGLLASAGSLLSKVGPMGIMMGGMALNSLVDKYLENNKKVYTLKEEKKVNLNTYTININKTSSIKVPFYSCGNLSLFFEASKGTDTYFKTVNMDDPDFQKREISCQIDADYVDAFGSILNFVTVKFRKSYSNGQDTVLGEFIFNKSDIESGVNLKSFFYPRLGVSAKEFSEYEYQMVWSLKGNSGKVRMPANEGDWIKSTDPAITLKPPFDKEEIDVDAGRDLFEQEGFNSANINFASIIAGNPKPVKRLLLRFGDAEWSTKVSIYHDIDKPVVYQTSWYSSAGEVKQPLNVMESNYLFVIPPKNPNHVGTIKAYPNATKEVAPATEESAQPSEEGSNVAPAVEGSPNVEEIAAPAEVSPSTQEEVAPAEGDGTQTESETPAENSEIKSNEQPANSIKIKKPH